MLSIKTVPSDLEVAVLYDNEKDPPCDEGEDNKEDEGTQGGTKKKGQTSVTTRVPSGGLNLGVDVEKSVDRTLA